MFTLTSKDNTGIFRFILTMSFNEYFLKHSGGGGGVLLEFQLSVIILLVLYLEDFPELEHQFLELLVLSPVNSTAHDQSL